VNRPFDVDEDGLVRVTGAVVFDKEVKDWYELSVYARDDMDTSAILTVNVSITDVNENPKLAMVDYYVVENRSPGTGFGVVTAQDVDTSSAGVRFLVFIVDRINDR
jgi:hypothetical protein